MKITNKGRASKLKKVFFVVSAVISLCILALFILNDHHILGLIGVGVFSLWYMVFYVADFQYIEFNDDNNTITLRYHKAISFGKQEYNSIEFPKELLQEFYLENSFFGKMTDLTLLIKTQRGVAEYPSVSLAAVSFEDRLKIRETLQKLVD